MTVGKGDRRRLRGRGHPGSLGCQRYQSNICNRGMGRQRTETPCATCGDQRPIHDPGAWVRGWVAAV
jgi:hypothetical protein